MRLRFRLAIPAAAILTLGACADAGAPTSQSAAAAPAPSGDRLATVEWEGSTPALYIQNADGTDRVRVHFDHVSDHVTGNYSPRQLPVTDATIRRIARMKWSPDGRYLAVIVAPAPEALQVVLVSADGRALRTVSPNSQYLWGDVEWSADSRRIAYMMATTRQAAHPDLFVTDLGADRVTRATTGARLSGYDTFRFDAAGRRLLFTEHLGWAEDGIDALSRLAVVDLASGAVVTSDTVIGEPQGFPRDGAWGLFIRWSVATPGARELVRREAGGAETVLATGDLWNAVVREGDREAILVAPARSGDLGFRLIGLSTPNDVHATLPTVPSAAWAALAPAGR